MPLSMKRAVRSLLETAGYQIQKSDVYSSQKLRRRLLFPRLKIDFVIDVGANSGQFAKRCRDCGYEGHILSFEPTSAAHASLVASAAADPRWNVAERMALGAATGEVDINIAANSFSSSILPMLDSHLSADSHSGYVHREKAPVRRLDDVLSTPAGAHNIFLKLDVQGFEPQVLAGAVQTLSHVLAVQLEMSLVPLYEGEILVQQMCTEMCRLGFDLWDLEPSFRDSGTGRLLQVDGVFTRDMTRL
jgi:FkbM family methyltransferase